MLAIRLQRTGRSGHAQFRVIVQDSRFHPTRGKIVSYLGAYDPHTKTTTLDKEAAKKYLDSGARPSPRVASLLKKEGVKLPDWVTPSVPQKRAVRNPAKRRSTRPPEEKAPELVADTTKPEVAATEAVPEEAVTSEAPEAETPTEAESATEPAENPEPAAEAAEPATEAEAPVEPAEEPVTETASEEPKADQEEPPKSAAG